MINNSYFWYLQVTKLIEDSCSTKITKTAIQQEKIIDWLVDNEVLSIALEGTFEFSV